MGDQKILDILNVDSSALQTREEDQQRARPVCVNQDFPADQKTSGSSVKQFFYHNDFMLAVSKRVSYSFFIRCLRHQHNMIIFW